ncbi:uncharacterized protein LOC131955467 [Physella acuta]|uniref:uncharacterized protein LOC131955467 n=1 Tax=Physella acuta TaxID=109671 RepID=UPI0027DDB980|nr:uncharacterized protein LOC131955467 [Physella acuta]
MEIFGMIDQSRSPIVVEWVEHVHRTRRATFNDTAKNWPHDIPYVIHKAYTGDRVTLRLVMDYISSRLCLTFHDVTNTYDPNDRTWFTSHGFKTNSYMHFIQGAGCYSGYGQGYSQGPQDVSPCSGFGINLHEILHSLGVIHSQTAPIRDLYMTIHESDIRQSFVYNYAKISDPTLVNSFFDPDSIMMYPDEAWHLMGLETYMPIRDDFFNSAPPFSAENVVFYELTLIYRCNELFCNNDQTDCGPGYHTLINGRCRCVCPDELDYNTNCRTHINGPSKNVSWPETQIVLYGSERCPTGFDPTPARLPVSGRWAPTIDSAPDKYSKKDRTMTFLMCKKSTPVNPANVKWNTWPRGGDYCIVKPKGQKCGGVFEDGGLEFKTFEESHPIGDIGNITINGNIVRINYCCRDKEHYGLVVELPNSEPFKLVAKYHKCPVVQGMKSTYSTITIWTDHSLDYGAKPPLNFFFQTEFLLLHYLCHYQPPVYGCSQFVTLNRAKQSVTIATPGFGSKREPDRRCFYSFTVPVGSRLKLTLNKFDPHVTDEFLIKRYHKWQDPILINGDYQPYQLVSEGDYLSLQYWASWEKTNNRGIKFTVDVVLAEEMCYDVATKGADYYGEKSVTETFEPCVPWEKATSCDDFPFDGFKGISLLESGSSCRNPGGSLLQPWCYTFVRGSVCHKRYCDVCNLKAPVDILSTCSSLKQNVPEFCRSAIERHGCFATCKFPIHNYKPAKCSPPSLPSDVYAAGGLKSVYKEGEVINVTCTTSGSLVNVIRCTKTGWSGQALACKATGSCKDKYQNCENILAKFPEFCSDKRSNNSALTYCKRSCGGCPEATRCSDPVGLTYIRTSRSAVISPGQVMNFTCNYNLYHVDGDLHRACSTSGALLGTEPYCQSTPLPVDIHLEKIRNRRETLPEKLAFLMDIDDYIIPFNGIITRWYYYCEKKGTLNFIVFRPSGSDYIHLGTNSVECEPKWLRTFNVPSASQVRVKQNDVVGAYSLNPDTLSVSNCYSAEVKVMSIPAEIVESLPVLKLKTKFKNKQCLVPSMGFRVEPY